MVKDKNYLSNKIKEIKTFVNFKVYNSKIFVNEEKGVVICVLETDLGIFKGKANCSPKDTFNSAVGKKIAYNRALRQANAYSIRFLKEKIITPVTKQIAELNAYMAKSANIIKTELEKLDELSK